MRHRSLIAAGSLAVVGLTVWLAGAVVAGQAPSETTAFRVPASTYTPPKTPWGDPDLQGIWTDDYATPLQRAARYAGREFFTDAERADLDKQRATLPGRDFR
ncbi:MAG: hypothetical protein ACREUP_08425, partial [Burkholderiales bacterium]